MSELESVGSILGNSAAASRVIEWPVRRPGPEPQIYCAYNPVRQKFLSGQVELADLQPLELTERLRSLTPGSKTALWLAPFLGISPDQTSVPIDIVYLDRYHCVLTVIESFPMSEPNWANWPASYAIVLPANTIASSGTLAGDQLILCSPQKMKRRLHGMKASTADVLERETFSHNRCSLPHDIALAFKTTVQMADWKDLLDQTSPLKQPPVSPSRSAAQAVKPAQTPPRPQHPDRDAVNSKKNWLFCLFSPQKREMRTLQRESLPWVGAYFFNGGTPAPAAIRNISFNGMYVITRERWYPGTIVRVTLSDWRLPSPEHTVTVNAMAVRWGKDGVGLRFIFPKPRHGEPASPDEQLVEVTREQLKDLLHRFKDSQRLLRWRNRLLRKLTY